MKRSKFFLATGALVLAVSAIFATKANKKQTLTIHSGANSTNTIIIHCAASALWTTNSGAGNKAFATVYTATLSKVIRMTLYTTASRLKTLYY